MFPALHELLVDDFASIVLAGLDVDGFLDNGVGSTAESPAGSVLSEIGKLKGEQKECRKRTEQGTVTGGIWEAFLWKVEARNWKGG